MSATRKYSMPRCSTAKVPGTKYGLLSYPSKMRFTIDGELRQAPSFSLPAGDACPGAVFTAKLRADNPIIEGFNNSGESTCDHCYAKAGLYRMYAGPSQNARYEWVKTLLRENRMDEFVSTMVAAIRKDIARTGSPYMRVHDSGDLFSPNYTRAWIEICAQLPEITFWFPTRSYRLPWLNIIRELHALPNVVVHPSALEIDGPAPEIDGLGAGTGVSSGEGTCHAAKPGVPNCGGCHKCFSKTHGAIYGLHTA